MSLPAPWVDRLFERLTLVYGREFLARWDGVPIADVKANWAHELAGFERHPQSIAHALKHLPPDRPPTVLQFRAMCRAAPDHTQPQLLPPKALPADVERVAEQLAQLHASTAINRPDRKDWARRILARREAGERPSATSVRFAREALGMPANATQPPATAGNADADPGAW